MKNQYDFVKKVRVGAIAGLVALVGISSAGCQTIAPASRHNSGEVNKTVSLRNIKYIEPIESFVKEKNPPYEWGFSCTTKDGDSFYIGENDKEYKKAIKIYERKSRDKNTE